MKKFIIFYEILIFIFVLIVSSCGNNSFESKKDFVESNYIKKIIEDKEKNIIWVDSLEPERLEIITYEDEESFSQNVKLDVSNAKFLLREPVFPYLEDFVSLDISSLNSEAKQNINKFCEIISNNFKEDISSLIAQNYYFSFVFFKQDLTEKWNEKFGLDFPADSEKIFSSWILGEPFIENKNIQIPIRFFCEKGFLDIELFYKMDNNSIYKINIIKWGH